MRGRPCAVPSFIWRFWARTAFDLQPRSRFPPEAEPTPMPLPTNDPFIEAIAERVRSVVARQSCDDLEAIARSLALPEAPFHHLIANPEAVIDSALLIDVLAALVRVYGVDPKWLLTGEYDPNSHRRVLERLEAHDDNIDESLREHIRQQYIRLRAGLRPWFLTA